MDEPDHPYKRHAVRNALHVPASLAQHNTPHKTISVPTYTRAGGGWMPLPRWLGAAV